MKLNVRAIKNAELYNKLYQRFQEEPEVYDRPEADVILLPHNIADYLIVAYKLFIDFDGSKMIGIYTTLEEMSFITVPYDEKVLEVLDGIIEDHNFIFVEPQFRYEEEVSKGIENKD